MTLVPIRHEPTFEFTGLSHWCACRCSWRSGLSADKGEIEAQYDRHLKESR